MNGPASGTVKFPEDASLDELEQAKQKPLVHLPVPGNSSFFQNIHGKKRVPETVLEKLEDAKRYLSFRGDHTEFGTVHVPAKRQKFHLIIFHFFLHTAG
jgi:hypothetical protein